VGGEGIIRERKRNCGAWCMSESEHCKDAKMSFLQSLPGNQTLASINKKNKEAPGDSSLATKQLPQ
jgi:hypothetical protein